MTEPEKGELVLLTSVNTAAEAEIARIGLHSDGIECQIEGELQAGLAGVLPIKIYVKEGDLERAMAIANVSVDDRGSN